jgi:hypothetical protein
MPTRLMNLRAHLYKPEFERSKTEDFFFIKPPEFALKKKGAPWERP